MFKMSLGLQHDSTEAYTRRFKGHFFQTNLG